MNICDTLPIKKLIKKLSCAKKSPINFNELKTELTRKNNDKPIYYINIKEDDSLAIIYYNDLPTSNIDRDEFAICLEQSCRSCIIDKSTLNIIASQFNKIIYNNETKEYLADKDWSNVVVQKCYEGTLLLVYNHNETWYVSTRRCLNSDESTWIKNKSYHEMFMEAINGKIELDELDKNLCYHFVLIHHKNKNIVNYSELDDNYAELYHTLTTTKNTLNEVECVIEKGIKNVQKETFGNFDELINSIQNINSHDECHRIITTEGYIIRIYEGVPHKSPFKIAKLQTPLYQSIVKLKPNNSNIHQSYLELYQTDLLNEFLPYSTKFNNDIIQRMHSSMKNVSKEILDLYHSTRQKKNINIYMSLTEQYRKILYGLHGLYIEHRKQDFVNNDKSSHEIQLPRSINVHDVYHYIKNLTPRELRQIFFERLILLENPKNTFLNRKCMYSIMQSTLMFGNIKMHDMTNKLSHTEDKLSNTEDKLSHTEDKCVV
jgi:hypothetical protein